MFWVGRVDVFVVVSVFVPGVRATWKKPSVLFLSRALTTVCINSGIDRIDSVLVCCVWCDSHHVYSPGSNSHGTINPLLAPHSHKWGQNTQTIGSLSPKRDWGPKKKVIFQAPRGGYGILLQIPPCNLHTLVLRYPGILVL